MEPPSFTPGGPVNGPVAGRRAGFRRGGRTENAALPGLAFIHPRESGPPPRTAPAENAPALLPGAAGGAAQQRTSRLAQDVRRDSITGDVSPVIAQSVTLGF